MSKISVIVPTFNTEKYIKSCINSILTQTHQNIEVIVVDDGSTDNTVNILQELSRVDGRVIVCRQKNRGAAIARNTAVDLSTGEYIMFVDSDDHINRFTLENLLRALKANDSDIACCLYSDADKSGRLYNQTSVQPQSICIKSEDALINMMYERDISNAPWGKLFKSNLVKNNKFINGKVATDLGTMYKIFSDADKVALVTFVGYFYTTRNDSLIHKKFTPRRMDGLLFARRQLHHILSKYPEASKAAENRLFMEAVYIYTSIPNSNNSYKKYKNECVLLIKKYRAKVLFDKSSKLSVKMYALTSYLGVKSINRIRELRALLNRILAINAHSSLRGKYDDKRTRILVFPIDSNPYQSLLYKDINSWATVTELSSKFSRTFNHIVTKSLLYFPGIIIALVGYRFRKYKILHIHWLFSFSVPAAIPFSKYISYFLTVTFICIAKLLGYKIVWTVHNVLPHHQLTSNDLGVRRILSKFASAKIVHGAESINMMQELSINTENTHVIPHGNLSNLYPNEVSKIQARKELGIPLDATVLLIFGRLEPYKNLGVLIPCFASLLKDDKKTHLIIAGKSGNEAIKRNLIEYKKKYGENIHVYDKFTPEKDVQLYFKSSDLDVYPYKKVTTSSAALLSFTFGNTVLAPFMGNFKDMPKDSLFFYDPNKENDLGKQLRIALSNKKLLATKSKNAKNYADSLSWEKIAKQTYRVYEDVLDR